MNWETIYEEVSDGYWPKWRIETQRMPYKDGELLRLLMTDHHGIQTASGLGFRQIPKVSAVEGIPETPVAETPVDETTPVEGNPETLDDAIEELLSITQDRQFRNWLDTHCTHYREGVVNYFPYSTGWSACCTTGWDAWKYKGKRVVALEPKEDPETPWVIYTGIQHRRAVGSFTSQIAADHLYRVLRNIDMSAVVVPETAVAPVPETPETPPDPFAAVLQLQSTEALAAWLDTHCERRPATRDGKRHWAFKGRWIASVGGVVNKDQWEVLNAESFHTSHYYCTTKEAVKPVYEVLTALSREPFKVAETAAEPAPAEPAPAADFFASLLSVDSDNAMTKWLNTNLTPSTTMYGGDGWKYSGILVATPLRNGLWTLHLGYDAKKFPAPEAATTLHKILTGIRELTHEW